MLLLLQMAKKQALDEVLQDVIPSFVALFNYIEYADTFSSSRVRDYFSSSKTETSTETVTRTEPSLSQVFLDRLVTSMVDRYIHLHGDAPFTIEQFAAIYQPLESAVFNADCQLKSLSLFSS